MPIFVSTTARQRQPGGLATHSRAAHARPVATDQPRWRRHRRRKEGGQGMAVGGCSGRVVLCRPAARTEKGKGRYFGIWILRAGGPGYRSQKLPSAVASRHVATSLVRYSSPPGKTLVLGQERHRSGSEAANSWSAEDSCTQLTGLPWPECKYPFGPLACRGATRWAPG